MAIDPSRGATYTDLQSLTALKREARAQDPAALRETARQFESVSVPSVSNGALGVQSSVSSSSDALGAPPPESSSAMAPESDGPGHCKTSAGLSWRSGASCKCAPVAARASAGAER